MVTIFQMMFSDVFFKWNIYLYNGLVPKTVAYHYNAVEYDTILHVALQWLKQKFNKSLNSQ